MTRTEFILEFDRLSGDRGPKSISQCRDVEHVTLQTGGSWGSAVGCYVGGEHTAPMPFTGWEG